MTPQGIRRSDTLENMVNVFHLLLSATQLILLHSLYQFIGSSWHISLKPRIEYVKALLHEIFNQASYLPCEKKIFSPFLSLFKIANTEKNIFTFWFLTHWRLSLLCVQTQSSQGIFVSERRRRFHLHTCCDKFGTAFVQIGEIARIH